MAAVLGGTSLAGGVGSVPKTLVGALIIGVLANAMNLLGIGIFWQPGLRSRRGTDRRGRGRHGAA